MSKMRNRRKINKRLDFSRNKGKCKQGDGTVGWQVNVATLPFIAHGGTTLVTIPELKGHFYSMVEQGKVNIDPEMLYYSTFLSFSYQ